MAQLSLFDISRPYKYIIDSSSIFSQKPTELHRRIVNRSLWENIDSFIKEQKIVLCSEIRDEIIDKNFSDWLNSQGCIILDVDEEIQENVIRIVTEHPKLVDFEKVKSSGDAFLIATAMKYNLTVITEENKDKLYKIPKVCEAMGVECLDIVELCTKEGWQF
ncbi:MAG: DUF4411 family protein [Eubacteriales bacterium]|nr:DUF4411 family protein [Eubacteriales bacterium]MDZ4042108.1 DUF4411 family protein [Eubacteriales bacterium]